MEFVDGNSTEFLWRSACAHNQRWVCFWACGPRQPVREGKAHQRPPRRPEDSWDHLSSPDSKNPLAPWQKQTLPGKLNPRSSKSIANGHFWKISIFSLYCHQTESRHQPSVKDDRLPSPNDRLTLRSLEPCGVDFSSTFSVCIINVPFFCFIVSTTVCINNFTWTGNQFLHEKMKAKGYFLQNVAICLY